MALKTFNPTTPALRGLIQIDRKGLWKGRPEKSLVYSQPSRAGRNAQGRITVRHRGGGHKRLLRCVDFYRKKHDVVAKVERLEYDPGRTAFIALICYSDGAKSYIVAPHRLEVGDSIVSSQGVVEPKIGNAMPLRHIPVGLLVHCVEMRAGGGGKLARSAGSYVRFVGKDAGYAQLRLSSGELRVVPLSCMATIGSVSNPDARNTTVGKAGRSRWLGRRPSVRGVVMNPVDHPHGGGEGRTSGGRHPVSPWGLNCKGKKTRSRKKYSNRMIIRRRKK